MVNESSFEVTIIVATYNPEYHKLRSTLISILKQKNLNMEIIVTDDGSKDNLFVEIYKIFEEYNFKSFQLLSNEKNEGTCKNIYKALVCSKGKYVKFISPGDFLYKDNTLKNWINFMNENEIKLSFGTAVHYFMKENRISIMKTKDHPMNRELYKINKYNNEKAKVDYLVLGDTAIGATFIADRICINKYFNQIVNRVKYAEDCVYRIMILDGVQIIYYPENVIWYEFGTGISTQTNEKWRYLLKKDFDESDIILSEKYKNVDSFSRKYIDYLRQKKDNKVITEIMRAFRFPYYINIKLKTKLRPDYSKTAVDCEYISDLMLEGK